MYELLRCRTCHDIIEVSEEHFRDVGELWDCPTCGTVITAWEPALVDLADPFAEVVEVGEVAETVGVGASAD